jgi:Tol biopolymer transport system component
MQPCLDLPSNAVFCRSLSGRGLQFDSGLQQAPIHGEIAMGAPPSERPLEDRLDSWKEIAAYLNRDVTTVQRWEKREAMPVHRHLHDRMGSVYASRAELDAWARGRNLRAAQENGNDAAPAHPPAPPLHSQSSTFFTRWRFTLLLAAAAATLAIGAGLWLQRTEHFWRNPIADARLQTVTDFSGVEQAAAVSRDGHFVAFLSDRDGPMDVWVTQVGSGEFHNLTRGSVPGLVNPSIRTLGFSPDGSLVTFWVRKQDGPNGGDISTWGVPTLGGEPRPYLEGVAEYAWSPDGSRLAYHTPGPGDPLFVSDGTPRPGGRPIFTAPAGLHSHFPLWSPNAAFLYFVEGTLPDKLDIWRIPSAGGAPERITSHNAPVSYPILVNQRTLMYLAGDAGGSGPWLYSMDVERRIPHQLSSGFDRYTSLAASADGRRLVATLATPKTTLWRLRFADSPMKVSAATPISLTTGTGFSPRLGADGLLYVSATGMGEGIWKLANGRSTQLWSGPEARVFGGPAISPDGRYVAFSVSQRGQRLLYLMQADGTNAHVVSDSLNLQGAPAWAPDGQSILSAVNDHGLPHLFRIPVDGRAPAAFVGEYSVDPTWAPDGRFVVYSGPDIGTTMSLKAVTPEATPHPLPSLKLTRGAWHLAFLPGGESLIVLRGEIQHKNLWLVDLKTGAERQLTNLPADFNIRDFDISPDGREVVLERTQERSDIVMLDLPKP